MQNTLHPVTRLHTEAVIFNGCRDAKLRGIVRNDLAPRTISGRFPQTR